MFQADPVKSPNDQNVNDLGIFDQKPIIMYQGLIFKQDLNKVNQRPKANIDKLSLISILSRSKYISQQTRSSYKSVLRSYVINNLFLNTIIVGYAVFKSYFMKKTWNKITSRSLVTFSRFFVLFSIKYINQFTLYRKNLQFLQQNKETISNNINNIVQQLNLLSLPLNPQINALNKNQLINQSANNQPQRDNNQYYSFMKGNIPLNTNVTGPQKARFGPENLDKFNNTNNQNFTSNTSTGNTNFPAFSFSTNSNNK